MKNKILIGLLLFLGLIVCLVVDYFSAYAFDFIALFIILIASSEFKVLLLKMGRPSFSYVPEIMCFLEFVGIFVGILCGLNAFIILIIMLSIFVLGYVSVFLGSSLIFKKELEKDEFKLVTNFSEKQFALFKTNNTFSAVLYPTILLSFIFFINHIQSLGLSSIASKTAGVPLGLFGIILVFAICVLTDTFAMMFGSLIKGKKLCPAISPNKTISGALFGILGGTIGGMATFGIFSAIFKSVFSSVYLWQFALVGFIGSLIAQGGDLLESFFKRKANVKDSGDFFRSHGGVLDRLDSVMFTVPYVFICLLFIFG